MELTGMHQICSGLYTTFKRPKSQRLRFSLSRQVRQIWYSDIHPRLHPEGFRGDDHIYIYFTSVTANARHFGFLGTLQHPNPSAWFRLFIEIAILTCGSMLTEESHISTLFALCAAVQKWWTTSIGYLWGSTAQRSCLLVIMCGPDDCVDNGFQFLCLLPCPGWVRPRNNT